MGEAQTPNGRAAAGTPPEGTLPLAGTTIVENASFVAAPTACLHLAKLGARVIRIDPLGGGPDFGRWPLADSGDSLFWHTANRAKESVALNMRDPRGKELAQALITAPGDGRGVFVENSVGRAFLDDAVLRANRPDLIHVKVLGSTDGGPAVDYTVNAESGIPTITGPAADPRPTSHALPAWDLLCGQMAATAVVTGLLQRATTGRGVFEEISLEDVARTSVADLGWYSETLRAAGGRPKVGNHVYGTFGQDFATRDGRIIVVGITKRQWAALQKVTGTEEVFAALAQSLDVDFADEGVRYTQRELIVAVVSGWFAAHTTDEALAALRAAGGLAAAYRTPAQVAAAVGTAPAAGLYRTAGGPLGDLVVGTSAIRVDGYAPRADRPVVFGADTQRVLAEDLGMNDKEIAGLRDRGII
jgi:2-methylfumaryl-CoA isomerase